DGSHVARAGGDERAAVGGRGHRADVGTAAVSRRSFSLRPRAAGWSGVVRRLHGRWSGAGDDRGVVRGGSGTLEESSGRKRAPPRHLVELRPGNEGAAPGALRRDLHDGNRPRERTAPAPGPVRGGGLTLR